MKSLNLKEKRLTTLFLTFWVVLAEFTKLASGHPYEFDPGNKQNDFSNVFFSNI